MIRAVTGYAMVAGDAPMWQQVTSGTPLGDVELRRCVFRTEGAKYNDIKSAIASHRTSEGGNGKVCLVIERATDEARPRASEADLPRQEPLFDVIARDLKRPPTKDAKEAKDRKDRAQGRERGGEGLFS